MNTQRIVYGLALLVAGLTFGSWVAAQNPEQPEPADRRADASQPQPTKPEARRDRSEAQKRQEAERRDERKAREAASKTGDAREEEEEDDPR